LGSISFVRRLRNSASLNLIVRRVVGTAFKLAVNLALPALGIVLAALAQLALTTLWPGIQAVPSAVVSLDSYFVVLLVLGLCFLTGRWAHHNVPTVAGATGAAIAPLAWLGLILNGNFTIAGSIAWFRPLTIFIMFTAIAPLVGVAFGWALSSLRIRRHRGV
jgi:hypothetical protein